MRLAVVGTGLIGASAGLAARRAGFPQVAGWDEDRALEVAAERGAVVPAGSLAEALRGADVVLVAVPVAVLPDVVRDVLESAPAKCTVTDARFGVGPECGSASESCGASGAGSSSPEADPAGAGAGARTRLARRLLSAASASAWKASTERWVPPSKSCSAHSATVRWNACSNTLASRKRLEWASETVW